MIDNKTPNLSLPLPHESNLLTDDVPRLREAFAALDTHAAQLASDLSAALTAATDAAKTALWSGVTGKPDAFPPTSHGHTFAELSDTPAAFPPASHGHDWTEVGGKPVSYPPAGHEHGWTELTGKPATFTPASHSHPVGEISGTLPTSKGGTGNTSGNAPTASRWQNTRNFSLYGDATGSVNWDGSGNVSLPVTLAASAKGPMMPAEGTFVELLSESYLGNLSLPAGGTWAYCLMPAASYDIMVGAHNNRQITYGAYSTCTIVPANGRFVGIAPGGSRLGNGARTTEYFGFAWRIA